MVERTLDSYGPYVAVLKVLASGICAADEMLWSGVNPWNLTYPLYPGHEIFGQIIEISSGAGSRWDVTVGDQVAVQVNVPCEECLPCQRKQFNLCLVREHFGTRFAGSFGDLMPLPERARVHRFLAPVPPRVGGLSETFANAHHIIELANIDANDSVLIMGMGAIGSAVLEVLARRLPPNALYVLSSSEEKRILLSGRAVNPIAAQELQSRANSFDVVLECSGNESYLQAALSVVRVGGKIVLYGVYGRPVCLDANVISEFKAITIIGGHLASDSAFVSATNFLSEFQRELGYLVTRTVGFEDFSKAFDSRPGPHFKTIFLPD